MTSPSIATTLEFLRALGHGGGLLELRLVRERPPVQRRFVTAADWPGAVGYTLKSNASAPSSLLFSVNSRCRPGGKDIDVAAVHAAVVDLDGKGLSSEEQQQRVRALEPLAPPVASVESGSTGHYHVYWRFWPPAAPEDARAAVKRLRRWLVADPTEPPSRMMRLPGSLNWKDGTAKLIKLRYLAPSASVSLAVLSAALDRLGVPQIDLAPARRPPARAVAPSRLDHPAAPILTDATRHNLQLIFESLPDWAQDLIRYGKRPGDRYQSRSEADAAAARALIDAGASDVEIAQVFAIATDGIGAKYGEAGEAGEGYLAQTIDFIRSSTPEESLVCVERVVPGAPGGRVLLQLHVVHGAHAGAAFAHGVESRSSVWPWLFRAAGLPMAAVGATAEALALRSRGLRARIEEVAWNGTTRLQVVRFLPPAPHRHI